MTERRQRQRPYNGYERRQAPHDYEADRKDWALQRDRRIVNVTVAGLVGCLASGIAGIGDNGTVIALATIFGGLLAVPKFLEWDERRWRSREDDR